MTRRAPGGEAREHDRVRRSAGPRDDDVRPGQRTAHRQLDTDPEPGRVGVEADQPAIRVLRDIVHRADRPGVALDLVDEAGDHLLVRRRRPRGPANSGPRAARTASSTASGSSSSSTYRASIPAAANAGVVHHLRMATPERLAEEGDPPGHDATATVAAVRLADRPGRRREDVRSG